MQKFFKSGGAFILLGLAFMVIALMAEKPAAYIGLGAVWLALGIIVVMKQKQ